MGGSNKLSFREHGPHTDVVPVYLIVADETEEFSAALHYAARIAGPEKAKIAILTVLEPQDRTHWNDIEERMREEMRAKAEEFLKSVAQQIRAEGGMESEFFIEEGKPAECVIRVVRDNPDIVKVILAASTKSGGPGPLITYFTGKGLTQLPVPVTIIPDHLEFKSAEDSL